MGSLHWAGCRRVVGILSHDRSQGMAQVVPREESQDFSSRWVQHRREGHSVMWAPCTVLVLLPVSFPAETIHV